MELIRRFPPDLVTQALVDWQWLPGLPDKTPLVASAFGDVFLHDGDGVWFLDTVEGKLTREWDSPESLQEQLNTSEGQDRFLIDIMDCVDLRPYGVHSVEINRH